MNLLQICGLTNIAITVLAISNGSDRHFDTLSVEQQQNTIKWTIAAFCPGIFSFALPKLGVVALLTKLLEPSKIHRMFLWVSSSLITLLLFGCVIILYAQCQPSRSQWDFEVRGTCWSPWVLVNYANFSGGEDNPVASRGEPGELTIASAVCGHGSLPRCLPRHRACQAADEAAQEACAHGCA